MKIFVSIDITKLKYFAAAISSDGEILIEPFKFTNDADGFQLLVSKLESSIRTASSSVLSRRHTTVTTLFDTLLLSSTKCVC